jgi:hypothetical protein
MKTNLKMGMKVWTMSKELEEKLMRGLMELGVFVMSLYIIYYLFAPVFDINMILEAWTQPASFMKRLMDVMLCYTNQMLDIISGFSAGQVLLLLIPGLVRKSI